MVQATDATWLEMPTPRVVRAVCMRLSVDHPGEQVVMTWVNACTMAVFVEGQEADDEE